MSKKSALNSWIGGVGALVVLCIPAALMADDRPDFGTPTYAGEWQTNSEHSGSHPGHCTGEDWG